MTVHPELLLAPAAIVASLLVLYFDWRGRLRRRIVAGSVR
jgi:hypothetical protein